MTRTLFGMVLVLAHAATTFAGVGVLDSTGSAVGATVTVELALSIESDLSPRAVELMRAEIDRIWQPYSVVIGWDAAGPDGSPERLRLTIADSELDRPQQSAAHAALAWIWFDTPARAGTEIRVSVDAARRLVSGVRVGGRSVAAWPALGETLLGRALGRSVAHEVGHYLLASSRHTDDGLM
jgi:hypothetical protein